MMIGRELAANAKQEGNVNNTAGDDQKISKLASSSNNSITTSSWSRLKDPRIVRVSRAFGGKDRHSKVCTVRGLRDRRVRLSVPTAIQLYDLQDRLGLNQPSKVVDWLLDAAKHEIDELPPLQMPPNSGNLIISSHNLQPSGSTWNSSDHVISRPKSKQVSRRSDDDHQEGSKQGHDFDQDDDNHHNGTYNVSSSNNFLISNNSAHQASYTSLLRWDPSTLSLAQSGLGAAPTEDHNFHNFNVVSVASAAAAAPQVLVYQPPVGITQSYFPSTAEYHDHVPKHINFQMLNNSNNSLTDSTSQQQSIRPFHMANFLSTTTQKDRAGGNELSSNNEGDFGSSR